MILGRTIKEFTMHCMTIPVVYSFLWMSVFGGVGLRMERDAEKANITCTSLLGGKNSTESYNGLYRLSCRFVIIMLSIQTLPKICKTTSKNGEEAVVLNQN